MWKQAHIADDELQDFWAGCQTAGLDPQTFVVSALEDTPLGVGHVKRIITVKRNQVSKDYEASSGHDWLAPALLDVSAGHYGNK